MIKLLQQHILIEFSINAKNSIKWTIEPLNDFEYYIDLYLQNRLVKLATNFIQAF